MVLLLASNSTLFMTGGGVRIDDGIIAVGNWASGAGAQD